MLLTTVKAIFLEQRKYGIDWPGARYDLEGAIQEYTHELSKIGQELGVHIDYRNPFYDSKDIATLADEEKEHASDGIVVIPLCQIIGKVNDLLSEIVDIGRPTIIFTPYFWMGRISELYTRDRVYFLSTLDFDNIKYGIKMIKAARQLQDTRVVVLRGEKESPEDTVLQPLGTKVRILPRARFVQEFTKVSETRQVDAIAEEYMKNAEQIVEPTKAEVIEAAKTYVTAKNIMKAEEADAITLDCLGLIGTKELSTTPCIGFSRLCDQGIAAACEADVDSLLTMLILRYLFDKPSFIGDPTVDTVRNTWINSHCTSPTKLGGIYGSSEPFLLRRYGHLDVGVSPQVLWRKGQRVTLVKYQTPGEMVMGSGTVIRNIDTPPSHMCITSVEVQVDGVRDVTDIAKHVKGLHVLLMYDDKAKELASFCQLLGIKSIPLKN
jgi:hypothetical protein